MQLSKQSYSDSKFKMESEGGSSSDFDENEYGLDMSDDFLDLSMKEDALDVKKEKLDPGCDDSAVSMEMKKLAYRVVYETQTDSMEGDCDDMLRSSKSHSLYL